MALRNGEFAYMMSKQADILDWLPDSLQRGAGNLVHMLYGPKDRSHREESGPDTGLEVAAGTGGISAAVHEALKRREAGVPGVSAATGNFRRAVTTLPLTYSALPPSPHNPALSRLPGVAAATKPLVRSIATALKPALLGPVLDTAYQVTLADGERSQSGPTLRNTLGFLGLTSKKPFSLTSPSTWRLSAKPAGSFLDSSPSYAIGRGVSLGAPIIASFSKHSPAWMALALTPTIGNLIGLTSAAAAADLPSAVPGPNSNQNPDASKGVVFRDSRGLPTWPKP